MQRYFIIIPFAVFLNFSQAKASHLRDSIGVENLNGKKLILHQVVAKDTYYSLGRRYSVSPKEIMTYNESKFLSIGLVVKVPTNVPFSGEPLPKKVVAPINVNLPPASKAVTAQQTAPATSAGSQDDGNMELTEHTVEKKENLMMLAHKYGTTVNEIKRVNDLHTVNLRIGQVLKIPVKAGTVTETAATPVSATPAPTPVNANTAAQPIFKKRTAAEKKQEQQEATAAVAQPKQDTGKDQLIVHTVASNETMYSIATKYDLTLDQLKAKNNLTTNSLYVGQKLLIKGQYPAKGAAASNDLGDDAPDMNVDTLESVKNPSLRLPASRYGLSQLDEKGTGVWITDKDLDSSKMLVLHRTAPIGTIMKITNPMSNRSTFAKVVGKFTENESTKDVIIVVTKAVADALGALDKRFLCNLTYSGQANEQ